MFIIKTLKKNIYLTINTIKKNLPNIRPSKPEVTPVGLRAVLLNL